MDNKSSNPIQKKLDSEIKKIREEHGNNLLTFNTECIQEDCPKGTNPTCTS
jgi:hypothetical protein